MDKPTSATPSRRVRAFLGCALSALLTATLLGALAPPARAATDENPDFVLIEADLEHILKQIQIAEAHASGRQLLCPEPTDTSGKCVTDPALPLGLRTVDGSFNNLLKDQEDFGAADRPFDKLLPEHWRTADAAPTGAPPNPAGATDKCGETDATCYAMSQEGHFVYDSDARVVSNLIVDQTTDNPAAVAAGANTEGATTDADGNVFLPNTAPDEGLSAPFNMWFVLFGQFFDHGLDLVNKGGNGTIVVPLKEDDPLYNPGSDTNFLTLTRATRFPGPDGEIGTSDDTHNNQTTPYVDQNQTYTSHPAHQVFLREYTRDGDGPPQATGELLDGVYNGTRDGLPTWTDIKVQAREKLGIALGATPGEEVTEQNNDYPDVTNVPQVVTDPYGNFVPGDNGFPLLVTEDGTVEGNPDDPISTDNALRTNHGFLDDIAHGATQDPEDLSGYDNVALGDHFITGDGRGNENIGLTSVHHIFHSEHNRMVGQIKETLDEPGNEELKKAYQGVPNDYDELMGEPVPDASEKDDWSYEQRLFQAAKFATEMQYQHLVFEEFARRIQPAIDPIVFNENSYDATVDADISAEYAHVVYRFGHSMLNQDIHRRGFDGAGDVTLLDAFLNPDTYDMEGALSPDQAAGAVVNGTTNQVAGQIDEFVVDTLRNNLLGLPLDLATINLIRARDTGVPPLQTARKTFFDATGDPNLKPYESWRDFGLNLKNGNNFGRDLPELPEGTYPDATLVNFVAAYGQHPSVVNAQTTAAKREAANLLVNGGATAPADAEAFMNSTGGWASQDGSTTTGLENVDFWIGGLAEALEPFGGMLGSTFNHVFEKQLEELQFGDRFYYLFRNQGNQLFAALENNSFANLIRRNTDASLLPADIFSVQDPFIDLGNLPTPLPEGLVRMNDGTYRWDGDEHIEIHGTPGDDRMRGGQGDDALWGYEGRDRVEGGSGNDSIIGGDGDDILTDTFGDDTIRAGWGNDAINAGAGVDLVLGSHGKDFITASNDTIKDFFAGTGDDIVAGGTGRENVFGGEGDDWIDGGPHADLVQGDNANQFQNDPNGGNDVVDGGPGNDDIEGEGGDDILVGRPHGIDRHEGMKGYDFVTYRGDTYGVDVDLRFTTLQRPDNLAVRDRYDLVEAVSGGSGNDVLRGMNSEIDDVADLDDHRMTQETLDMIGGLRELLDPDHPEDYSLRFRRQQIGFDTDGPSNLMLGGPGSDRLQGRGGNDFIEGDAVLDVYLQHNGTRYDSSQDPQLQDAIFDGSINPGDLEIVRELAVDGEEEAGDTAVFGGPKAAYTVEDLGDDYWRVTHDQTDVEAEESEGNDVIHGIEMLEFADGCYVLETMESCGTYGHAEVVYDPPLQENDTISANVVFDGDVEVQDPTQIRFRWLMAEEEDLNTAEEWLAADVQHVDKAEQCETDTDGNLTCSTDYTLEDLVVDNLLRVEVTFLDDEGTMRRILSPPTSEMVANVNDVPVPPVLSTDDPVVGAVVRASGLSDGDGLEEAGESLQWIWQAQNGDGSWEDVMTRPFNITGYIPTNETSGRRLRVTVNYTDDLGTAESVSSEPTNPVGGGTDPGPADPVAPLAPAIAGVQPQGTGLLLSWEPPANDGGSPITGFEVTGFANGVQMGTTWDAGPGDTSLLIDGLEAGAGMEYTFSVAARNAVGLGASSGVTAPVALEPEETDPPEVENQSATGRPALKVNRKATVVRARRATLSDANGLGPITWSWQRRSSNGWVDVKGSKRALRLTDGLRGGRVRAVATFTDEAGFDESRVSRAVRVPRTRPGRVRITRVVRGAPGGRRTMGVRWRPPRVDGGWPVQMYRVTVKRVGGRHIRAVHVNGSRNAKGFRVPRGVYRIKVRAWNRAGFSKVVVSRKVRPR